MTKARDLANIISGGFTASDIPNLDTAKVTTGTFASGTVTLYGASSNDRVVMNNRGMSI